MPKSSGNRSRAQSGRTKQPSRSSSTAGASGQKSKEQLYNEAKRRNIKGRSSMSKSELNNALGRKS